MNVAARSAQAHEQAHNIDNVLISSKHCSSSQQLVRRMVTARLQGAAINASSKLAPLKGQVPLPLNH